MPFFVCIDAQCKMYNKIENVPTKFFVAHSMEKTQEVLEKLLKRVGIIENPYREYKKTLAILYTDYCNKLAINRLNDEVERKNE